MSGIATGSIVAELHPVASARYRHDRRIARAAVRSPAVGTLETVYPPQRAAAAQMRRDLRAYLADHAVDASPANGVVLAADEAFINAVSHAGGGDGMIRVSASVSKSEVSVEVQDGGGGFTYSRSHPRSVPDVRRPNGRGLFLIERLMDEVSVRSGRRGTVVRMVRHLANDSGAADILPLRPNAVVLRLPRESSGHGLPHAPMTSAFGHDAIPVPT